MAFGLDIDLHWYLQLSGIANLLFENKTFFIFFTISIEVLNCLWCNMENSHRFSILIIIIKKNCEYQFHFSVWRAVTYKKKSQTGFLHPIIYKSTYICAYTLDKTCIKNQIIYSQKKRGDTLFYFKCQVQGILREPAPKYWYIYLIGMLIVHQLCHLSTSQHKTIF
ncbi:hypothetical protein QTP88_018417 [Uroleucon formosanum]